MNQIIDPKKFSESLDKLITAQGLSKIHIAFVIGMPYGTFKNKLNPALSVYKFSPSEQELIRKVIKAMAKQLSNF